MKLVAAQVLEIRAKLAIGARPQALARDYKVTPVCINDIQRGITWKQLLPQPTHDLPTMKTAHLRNMIQFHLAT